MQANCSTQLLYVYWLLICLSDWRILSCCARSLFSFSLIIATGSQFLLNFQVLLAYFSGGYLTYTLLLIPHSSEERREKNHRHREWVRPQDRRNVVSGRRFSLSFLFFCLCQSTCCKCFCIFLFLPFICVTLQLLSIFDFIHFFYLCYITVLLVDPCCCVFVQKKFHQ